MVYIDGFLITILAGSTEEAFRAFAERTASIFRDHGATRAVLAIPHPPRPTAKVRAG